MATIDYKEKYEKALERAKYYHDRDNIQFLENIFPELAESDDERIRKEITELVMQPTWKTEKEFHRRNELCAWLEKQGEQKPYGQRKECTDCQFNYAGECKGYCAMKRSEQKPTDKIEPKFKVGDWVVCKNGSHRVFQVIERSWPNAKYRDIKGTEIFLNVFTLDKQYRPWTIQDAKDGDVLAAHECLVLFKEIDGLNIRCYCTYHYINHQKFYVDTLQNKTAFCPATKEQRDLLFSKMKEAGYEWDAEKKELKKIEQSPIDVRTTGYWNVEDVEQKPAWSEEDKRIWDIVWDMIDGKFAVSDSAEKEAKDWFISLKNRFVPRPKQEWSEEDYIEIKRITGLLEGWASTFEKTFYEKECKRGVAWLKSLKDRVQPQPRQEWSEEDNAMLISIENILIGRGHSFHDKEINWLKSLRHQSQWKPSDMELEVLRLAAEKDGTCLMGLYEQLKKLREE